MAIPTFSLAERDRRWKVTRTFMEEEGLDAMIVYSEHEDAGASAAVYDTWFTNNRPGSVIIFPRAGEPIEHVAMPLVLLNHMDDSLKGQTPWIATKNLRVGRDSATLSRTLEECGLAKSSIGVIGLEAVMPWCPEGIIPYTTWNSILQRFSEASFKPVARSFERLFKVLSTEEVAVLRHSASIGDAMAEAMVQAARPGVSETEVYKAGMAAAYGCGTVVPWMHFVASPEPAISGIPPWAYRAQTPRVLQEGDVINAEVFSNYGMRSTQHQVSIAIGQVHEDLKRAAAVARECYEAGLSAIRPKVRFGDVCEAMLRPVEEAGGWVRGPQIHSLNPLLSLCRIPECLSHLGGPEQGYPKVDSWETFMPDMVLEPGMSFALEPSCGFGRRMVTVGGTVIVGEDGVIELNPYTARQLTV